MTSHLGPFTHRILRIPAIALGLVLVASAASATRSPRPGKQFPAAYLQQKANHPHLFKLKGGLQGKAARARAAQRKAARMAATGDYQAAAAAISESTISGTTSIPVVIVEYANVGQPYGFNVLQELLFDGPNPTGTLTDYYDEVSYGNLDVTGTVFDWVTLPSNDTFYEGTNNGLVAATDQTGQLIEDALDLIDGGVDFGDFDNDGPDGVPNSGDDDGFVDFIAFVHPEIGGECGNSNMWSHRWVYRGWPNAGNQPYTTDDARSGGGSIRIDNYVIQPALNCSGGTIEIGVFAHEFGHAFGIPDLYDTDGSSEGIGSWSLMASGNWQTPDTPAHWDARSKSQLGWLTPTLLTTEVLGLEIPQVETSATAFQISVGNGEYFLLENRQAVGFDADIQECGLLIWHVDEAVTTVNRIENCGNFQQAPPGHYEIALEQADDACDLEANRNRGDDGDPFPGSTGNRDFASTTSPSSLDAAGNDVGVSVTNISDCAMAMTADVQAFPVPEAVPGPIDVVFLVDVTGSYVDDLPIIQSQMPEILAQLTSDFPDLRLGIASFRDFPFSPFGQTGDFAYQVDFALSSDTAAFSTAFAGLTAGGGNDAPEAQYEAVFQVLTGLGRDLTGDGDTNDTGEIAPSNIGWQETRAKVIYLLTDAPFHDSDAESYPGTALEAAGSSAVQALLSPGDPFIFTLIAENPGVSVTSGEGSQVPPIVTTELFEQASDLAEQTGGSVGFAGPDSSELAAAIDTTVLILEEGVPTVVPVELDVKPDSDPNVINPAAEGVLPVAILGSASLNVEQIDRATLSFGPGGAAPTHRTLGHISYLNDDDFPDLLSHYRILETGIAYGDTEACVQGAFLNGVALEGCDSIQTVPRCGLGFELALVLPPLVWIGSRRRPRH